MKKATVTPEPTVVGSTLLDDLAAPLKKFSLPKVDVDGIVESRRKDIDALVAANAATLQGVQELGRTEAELLKGALDQAQSLLRRLRHTGGEAPASMRDLVVQGVQRTLSDMRELAETGYRVQAETFAVISRRAQENLQELTGRLQPKS